MTTPEGAAESAATTTEFPDDGPAAPGAKNADRPEAPPSVDHFARQLGETAGAIFMYASVGGVFEQVEPAAFKLYRDRLLIAAGGPSDSIEVMLLEQVAMAHLNIGRLHFRSAKAENLKAARAYGAMAIALTGEFRRTALAISSYRAASTQRQPAPPARDVDAAAAPAPAEVARDIELGSNKEAGDGGVIPFEEPAPRRGRQAKRGEAQGAYPGRPRAATGRRAV